MYPFNVQDGIGLVLYLFQEEIVLFEFRFAEAFIVSRAFYDRKLTLSSEMFPVTILSDLNIDTHGEPGVSNVFGVEVPSVHEIENVLLVI